MTERPSTIQERKNLVIFNTEAEKKRKADSYSLEGFENSDMHVIKLPNRKEPAQPYGGGFPHYLVRHLRLWPYKEVEVHLHVCFPECDNVDCDYLEEVIEELRLQGRWAKDRPMFINTPGSGALFIANAAKADKWIAKQRLRLSKAEKVRENPIEATIPFEGPVSAFAEVLYRLERGGHISLLSYKNNEGNIAALCRTLCRVFPLHASSSKNPALALQILLSKIPLESLGPGDVDIRILRALARVRPSEEFVDPKSLL